MAATVQEAVRRLRIEATSTGLKEVTADLRAVTAAQDGVAVASETTSRAVLSQEKRFESIERRYVATVKAQQDYEKVQRQVNAAVQQNPALQERANAILAAARERHNQLTEAANDNARAIGLARHEMINLGRQAQDVGTMLAMGANPMQVVTSQAAQIVDIFASSQGTVKGFFGQMMSGASALITPMRALALGTTAIGVATYATYAIWKSFTLQLDDSARAIGVSTRELSQLQAAASFKGIASADFNQGIQGFARNVYEAREGMGGLASVFAANNVHAKTFDEYLGRAADLIRNARDDQSRLVLLQQMGLPATMDWVRLLSQGSEGLEKARQSAAAYAANDNMVQRAREFDEAWNKAWTNFGLNARSAFQTALDGGATFFDKMEKLAQQAGNSSFWSAFYNAESAAKAGVSLIDPNSFGARFDAANSNSAAGNTGLSDALRRRADQLRNGETVDPNVLRQQIALEQQRIGILGQTATVSQQVRAVELQIQQARLNHIAITAAEEQNLKRLAAENALGITQIQAYRDALEAQAQSFGMSAGQAYAHQQVLEKVNEAKRNGIAIAPEYLDQLRREADLTGAAIDANARLRDARATVSEFANDVAGSFLRGEDAIKSMTGAATNLIQKLSSTTIKRVLEGGSLFGNQSLGSTAGAVGVASAGLAGYESGNALTGAMGGALAGATFGPVGAAVGAIAGAVGGLIGAADQAEQQLEEAKKRWADMRVQVIAFNAAAAGVDLGPLTQQLNGLHSSFMSLVESAAEAQDWAAVVKLQTAYVGGINRTIDEFANGTADLSPLEASMKAVRDEATGLRETLDFLGKLTPEVGAAIDAGLIRRLDEVRQKAEAEAAAAARERASGYDDRLFAATNDTSTLTGALAEFERAAQRERAEEIAAGGAAINDLIAAQEAERLNIYKEFNDRALEDQRKVAQELQDFVVGISRSITAYLNGLNTSANSILSPQEQLAAAQSNFNAQLALAQTGDRDALTGITQVAQTLLDQAKSFHASSGDYASIYNQVTSALQGLTSIPPATVASADAQAIVAAVDQTTEALETQTAIINAQTAIMNASNSLMSAANSLATTQNSLLDAIRALTDVSAQQLTLLRTALSPTGINIPVSAAVGDGTNIIVNLNNQMVEALNKIVFNTWAISRNTAFQIDVAARAVGVYATGGWITGGTPGVDSVRLASGGLGMPDEFVVRRDVAQANRDWLPRFNETGRIPAPPVANDNRGGANNREELRALAAWNRADADRVVAKLDQVLAALEGAPAKTKDALRQLVENSKPRAAQGGR